MRETSAPGADLFRDARNTAPPTRARFEYQDKCVALRCIQNLTGSSPVIGVVLEWATDYVLLTGDGRKELVSVKHREPGQDDWSYAALKNENVFRDLHDVWKAMGESGTYVFESNHGFSRTARPYVIDEINPRASREAVEKLAHDLAIDVDETSRFLEDLRLRREPLPDRTNIDAVAIRDLQTVMSGLGLDPICAEDAYQVIVRRMAAASTQRPDAAAARIQRLAGLMRDVASRTGPSLDQHYVAIEDLRRLVAEIGTAVSRGLAPKSDPLFVGRVPEMASLDRLLELGSDQEVAPVVLTGMPGIGKSALARQYAAQCGEVVIARVVPADSRAALAQGLRELLSSVPRRLNSEAIAGSPSAGQALVLPEDQGLLLIIDGVTDPAVTEGLIPRRSRTRFIITATPTHLDDAFVHLQVDPLGQAECVTYLRSVIADESVEALGQVAKVLDGHPLGLVQAASYCRTQHISATGFLKRMAAAPAPLLGRGRAPDHPTTTAVAIREFFRIAVEGEPAALPLATVMACVAPEPLPESIFEHQVIVRSDDEEPSQAETALLSLTDVLVRDQAIAALHQFSLVIRNAEILHIHTLVQAVVRDEIPVEERPAWARACLVLLLHGAHAIQDHDENKEEDEALAASRAAVFGAHIAVAVEHAIDTESDPYIIYAALGWLGLWQMRYGELSIAIAYLTRCVQVSQGIPLGVDESSGALRQLANAQRAAGLVDQALTTIDTWSRLHPAGSSEVREALLARAQTYAYAARYPEARDALAVVTLADGDHVLDVRERIFRFSLLAEINRGLGHSDEALAGITAALSLTPDVADEGQRRDHRAALNKQAGIVLRESGRLEEALPHLRAAYDAVDNLPGVYTTETILALVNTLLDLGRSDEARTLVDQGLVLASPRGDKSLARGSFLQVRGRMALEAGELDQAQVDLEAAVAILRTGGDPYRVNLDSAFFNLGLLHLTQQRFADAVDCLSRARALEIEVYGPDSSDLILIDFQLAQAHFGTSEHRSAHTAITRCLELIRTGHPQARQLRDQVLTVAVAIDMELGLGMLPPTGKGTSS